MVRKQSLYSILPRANSPQTQKTTVLGLYKDAEEMKLAPCLSGWQFQELSNGSQKWNALLICVVRLGLEAGGLQLGLGLGLGLECSVQSSYHSVDTGTLMCSPHITL